MTTSSLLLLLEIGLVDLAEPSLSERLAGRRGEQLEAFPAHMHQGLLPASVAMGLDVMAGLVDAKVTDVAGRRTGRGRA